TMRWVSLEPLDDLVRRGLKMFRSVMILKAENDCRPSALAACSEAIKEPELIISQAIERPIQMRRFFPAWVTCPILVVVVTNVVMEPGCSSAPVTACSLPRGLRGEHERAHLHPQRELLALGVARADLHILQP